MKWMEPLMVELAGWTRLASAVPLIIRKLHEEDDLLPGLCEEALVRIGNDSVVAAVVGEFRDAERQFRRYATGVVERIRSDRAVENCLALFVLEKDPMIQRDLAHAALSQFAYGAVELVRQFLLTQRFDRETRSLRDYLVQTCKIMGEGFPEYDQWRADGQREREEHRRKVEELSGDPERLLLWSLQQIQDDIPSDESGEDGSAAKSPPERRVVPMQPVGSGTRASAHALGTPPRGIGRNDRCPCGSGKKYKKCCMNKWRSENPSF